MSNSASIEKLTRFARDVVIASTMHEPKNSLFDAISKRVVPISKASGLEWYISATEATKPTELFGLLQREFVVTSDIDAYPLQEARIEENHYAAILLALSHSSKKHVMYIDSDRLTIALSYFLDETIDALTEAMRRMVRLDPSIMVVNRTAAATVTHHLPLILTEGVIGYFYTKHLTDGKVRADPASTAYIMPRANLEKMLEGYTGGVLEGNPCDFPQGKLLMMSTRYGKPAFYSVNNPLRYEAPEQMRGSGIIVPKKHEWTARAYDELDYNASFKKAELEMIDGEWMLRYRTMVQWLDVLNKMYLAPRGIKDAELEKIIEEGKPFAQGLPAIEARQKATELFKQYNPSSFGENSTPV